MRYFTGRRGCRIENRSNAGYLVREAAKKVPPLIAASLTGKSGLTQGNFVLECLLSYDVVVVYLSCAKAGLNLSECIKKKIEILSTSYKYLCNLPPGGTLPGLRPPGGTGWRRRPGRDLGMRTQTVQLSRYLIPLQIKSW